MNVTLLAGRMPDAVKPCGAAIEVTVFDTATNARLVNTLVIVKAYPDGSTPPDAGVEVQTDGSALFTVKVEGIEADAGDLLFIVEAASSDGQELDRVSCPVVSRGSKVETSVYFGVVYEATVLYLREFDGLDEAGKRYPTRGGRYSLNGLGYDKRIEPADFDQGNCDLVVLDSHSLTKIDQLGPGRASKREDYESRNWLSDIRPALRLEVRVTKRRRMTLLPIAADELAAEWETVDPPATYTEEQLPMAPDRPVTWLRRFFDRPEVRGAYTSTDGDVGGGNCPTKYGGLRSEGGGVPTQSVLFAPPGLTPLEAGTAPASALSKGKYDEEQECWCSEVVFCPEPIGGDRYYFVISLLKSGGRLQFNSATQGKQRTRLRTVTFTLWREVKIAHIYRLAGVETDFNWELISNTYAAAYIKIRHSDPTQINPYTISHTIRDTVDQEGFYASWAGLRDETTLLPPGMTSFQIETVMEKLTLRTISRLCEVKGLDDPNKENNPEQLTGGHDFWMLCCKAIASDCYLAGLYMGNGQFYMVFQQDYTATLVHELGHALYLRHSLTTHLNGRDLAGQAGTGIGEAVTIVPQDNMYDHDPADAVACIMSYANSCFENEPAEVEHPVRWHFCALCLLKLRFWDTGKLSDEPWFRAMIHGDLYAVTETPILARDNRDAECAVMKCRRCARVGIADALAGKENEVVRLFALVRPGEVTNEHGERTLIDLNFTPDYRMVSDNADVAAAEENHYLVLKAQGTAEIRFEYGGKQSSPVTVTVGPPDSGEWAVHPAQIYINPQGGPLPGAAAIEFSYLDENRNTVTARINGKRFYLQKNGVPVAQPLGLITHLGHDGRVWNTCFTADAFETQMLEPEQDHAWEQTEFLAFVNDTGQYELRLTDQ